MPRGRLVRRLAWCAFLALVPSGSSWAHDEWNNLHIVYSARTAFTYPFDGRSPKIAAALLNHHETASPPVLFSLRVEGQAATANDFATFPEADAPLNVGADRFGIASVATRGVYDGRLGPAPAVGSAREVAFDFTFRLPAGVTPVGTPPPAATYTESVRIRFLNLGDAPVLEGPMAIAGELRLAAAPASNPTTPAPAPQPRVEVATPFSNWFPLAVTPATPAAGFAQALPERDDWHVRLSAEGYASRVIALGHPTDPRPSLALTLTPAATPALDYRRASALATPTGFWRGAVSETEATFVVFPGQATWPSLPASATAADQRAQRTASRIAKYTFAGTRVWEHAPGWETWAGDMTLDGRFVAYALQPAAHAFYTPTENKLVLLDGATGAILWSKSAAPNDAAVGRKLESLELAFSPDARWIAVGSVGSGEVTLVDRATGNFVWSVPRASSSTGAPPAAPTSLGFGPVRRLRFSADGQWIFCGSGDGQLRKLRASDGREEWSAFAGGWPNVCGLDLTPDGEWLAAGTNSRDVTLVRTSDGRVEWQRETQSLDAVFSPDGRHVATAGGQIYRTVDGTLAGMTKIDALTRFTPDGRHVLQLGREFTLHDLGGKLLKTFPASGLASTQWSHLTRDGRYAILLARDLTAASEIGIVIYERMPPAAPSPVPNAAPVVESSPDSQTLAANSAATFTVAARGESLSYRWRKNGADLPGQHSATLTFAAVAVSDAGDYTCVVANPVASVTTPPATLTVAAPDPSQPGRLANLAVRAQVDATPLLVGFAVGGAGTGGTKPLLIRGAGPALTPLGVTGALANPRLALFAGGARVLENDNWAADPVVARMAGQVGAFPFAASGLDAALAASAVRGSYSVELARADARDGIALAEIYDGSTSFTASTPRLVNVSARTRVTAGGGALIAGFVVAGPVSRTVLIRAIGPGLGTFGVRDALADPQLALFRENTPLATNDQWHEAPNALAVATAATQVGAFRLPPGSLDAALLLTLAPGAYSAQVSSADADEGSALVEVYEVP